MWMMFVLTAVTVGGYCRVSPKYRVKETMLPYMYISPRMSRQTCVVFVHENSELQLWCKTPENYLMEE